MAYRRKATSTRRRGASSRRSSARTTRRVGRARSTRRSTRGGGQTIKLVIEHATPGAARPDGMMLPQVEQTTRKARF